MLRFFVCLILGISYPVASLSDSCDDDMPPCPASYKDEFKELEEDGKKICEESRKSAQRSCDQKKYKTLTKLQHDTEKAFNDLLDEDDSIYQTCESFSAKSGQLRNELAGFRSHCSKSRMTCMNLCDPIIEKLTTLHSKASSKPCCSDLAEDIAKFIREDVKKDRGRCFDLNKKIAEAEREQNKWTIAKNGATQCWSSISETPNPYKYGGKYNTQNGSNSGGQDLSPSAKTEDPPPLLQGKAATAPPKLPKAAVREGQSSRRGSSQTRRIGQQVHEKIAESVANEILDEILDESAEKVKLETADAPSQPQQNQKRSRVTAQIENLLNTMVDDSKAPDSTKKQLKNQAKKSDKKQKEVAGNVRKKRRPASLGPALRHDKTSTGGAYDQVMNHRKQIAGQNEYQVIDGITPSHGRTIWQKISERYRSLQNQLAE